MKEQSPQTSAGCKKAICEKHGEYTSEPFKLKGFGGMPGRVLYSRCPQCEEEIEENRRLEKEQDEKALFMERISAAGIPKRFSSCSFDGYSTTKQSSFNLKAIKSFLRKFNKMKKTGTSIILCGRPGTGKTHLSCALAIELIKLKEYIRYTTSYKMLANIKSTYNKRSEQTESEAIKTYVDCSLLIIDEVGVQFGSDAEKILFYQIINGRYENMSPTILISNLNEVEVREFIGERAFDRLREGNGAVLSFSWGSYRK